MLSRITRTCQYGNLRHFSSQTSEELIAKHLGEHRKGILELGMYRPAAKNAFNKSLLRAFQNAIQDIKGDKNIRAVVLRSLVPGVFSAGADLKERSKLTEREVVEFVTELRNTFAEFASLPTPTIAAIEGHALGGGLELALSCDIRVAASSAKMGLVETKIGTIPGAGGTQLLPRLINPAIAKELIFTAKVLDGTEALQLGLVNHVVSPNETNDAAYQKSLEISEKILPNSPMSVKLSKKAINQGLDLHIKTALSVEEAIYAQIVPTKDRIEGLLAILEKRAPVYKGE